jgi:hypothetical protein
MSALFLLALAASTPAADVDVTSPALDAVVEQALALELELEDDGACQGEPTKRKRKRRRNRQQQSMGSGGAFGVGLQLGWPSGITLKYRLGGGQAVQAAIGVGGGAALVLTVDYVWHFFQITSIEPGYLDLYIGGGLFVGLLPFGFVRGPFYDFGVPIGLGVEVPFGVSWTFHRLPLDLYLELAPVLGVFPWPFLDFKGSLGFRFYF